MPIVSTQNTRVAAARWSVQMNHHDSHTAVAFYDWPFFDPLIVSHDGGGIHGTHLHLVLASVVDEAPIAPLTMFLSLLTR